MSTTEKETPKTVCLGCQAYEERDGKALCHEVEGHLTPVVQQIVNSTLRLHAHWYRGGIGDCNEILFHVRWLQRNLKSLEDSLIFYTENKALAAKDECVSCAHFDSATAAADKVKEAQKLTAELMQDAAK